MKYLLQPTINQLILTSVFSAGGVRENIIESGIKHHKPKPQRLNPIINSLGP
jgi:hypothetical protein